MIPSLITDCNSLWLRGYLYDSLLSVTTRNTLLYLVHGIHFSVILDLKQSSARTKCTFTTWTIRPHAVRGWFVSGPSENRHINTPPPSGPAEKVYFWRVIAKRPLRGCRFPAFDELKLKERVIERVRLKTATTVHVIADSARRWT